MYDYAENVISMIKVKVNKNRDGNICKEGEAMAGFYSNLLLGDKYGADSAGILTADIVESAKTTLDL